MKGWLLDTHVVGAMVDPGGARSVKVWLNSVDERDTYLSVLTLGEYEKGIANLPEGDPRRLRPVALLQALPGRFSGRILGVSEKTVRLWGSISGRIKRETGHPPPVIDTLLAATAIEHNLRLVTRNIKDVRHSGAILFDPWNP